MLTCGENSLFRSSRPMENSMASCSVLFIFQFPATIFCLISGLPLIIAVKVIIAPVSPAFLPPSRLATLRFRRAIACAISICEHFSRYCSFLQCDCIACRHIAQRVGLFCLSPKPRSHCTLPLTRRGHLGIAAHRRRKITLFSSACTLPTGHLHCSVALGGAYGRPGAATRAARC